MAINSGKKSRKKERAPAYERNTSKSTSRDSGDFLTEAPKTTGFVPIKPLNFIQGEYLEAIKSSDIIFGIGSAGTGKTFIAASYAAEQLYYKKVNKIILTRPNVETGRGLGFLPGELDEKYAPYLEPFVQVFKRALGAGLYEYALKAKTIDPKPLGFMRGASFDDAIILVDEAQNMTKTEFKMLLSRIGKNCKVILSGDPDQCDIPDSGLLDAVHRLDGLPGIEVVEFLDEDIVRSKMCKQVILAYKD